jgi:hypothetical protein
LITKNSKSGHGFGSPLEAISGDIAHGIGKKTKAAKNEEKRRRTGANSALFAIAPKSLCKSAVLRNSAGSPSGSRIRSKDEQHYKIMINTDTAASMAYPLLCRILPSHGFRGRC